MKKRHVIGIILFALCFLTVSQHPSDARGKMCPAMKKGCPYERGDLQGIFFFQASAILDNQEKLGLSDQQYAKIQDLKLGMEKDVIMKEAEMKVIALDIKSKLKKDTLDIEGLQSLIDKKFEIKKTKTKAFVNGIATLKNALTPEQTKKLKGLCASSSEEHAP